MDLHVIFRGLCLFVPAKEEPRVDVLFPETSGHAAHHVHHPLVDYRGLAQSPRQLRKEALHFLGLGVGSGTVSSAHPHMLRAGHIAGRKVPPGKLSNHPGDKVATRVSLPAPDQMVPGKRVWFHRMVNGTPECLQLTHQMTLVYRNVNAGALKPQTLKLGNPSNTDDLDEPQAETGSSVIVVRVNHLPDPAHEPLVCAGQKVKHVPMYYDFLEGANDDLFLDQKTHLARCRDTERIWTPLCAPDDAPPVQQDDETGTAFNCMLAQAEPE